MEFIFKVDSDSNVSISINGKPITGFSSYSVRHVKRGENKGPKISLAFDSPIIRKGETSYKTMSYDLPEQAEKVLSLSEFWSEHAEEISDEETQVKIKPKSKKKSSKKAPTPVVDEEELEELEDAPFDLEEVEVG